MDKNNFLNSLQKKRMEHFLAQDPENFDISFEIGGKKLYADKLTLCSVSTTFKSMLSDRWKKMSNESIKIETYSFEEFKEFLTFIYSGECYVSKDSIFTMIDMAEFYQVEEFKMACEESLSKMKWNFDNIIQAFETSIKYSMAKLKATLFSFITTNLSTFIQTEQFRNLPSSTMKEIVESNKNTLRQEELFEAVYKWAENRAKEKQEIDSSINLEDAIKMELSEILPFFKYQKMSVDFIIQFIQKETVLFSRAELSDILLISRGKVYVIVTDGNGKIMSGFLNCFEMDNVIEAIDSQKGVSRKCAPDMCYWKTGRTKPSKKSKLIKNDSIQWYLVYDIDGDITVMHRSCLESSDYLLAELFEEDGSELISECKIEIYRYNSVN